MYNVDIKESGHQFEKRNLVTQRDRKGGYDSLICEKCKIRGKSYTLGIVSIDETFSQTKAYSCPMRGEFIAPKKIKITICRAVGKAFANATPESIHDVVEAPIPYKNDRDGVWIMGTSEPIKILSSEYEPVQS